MGEIEAGLFEWWLGLYPPLLIAIHFANIALNHMNLRVPLPVSYTSTGSHGFLPMESSVSRFVQGCCAVWSFFAWAFLQGSVGRYPVAAARAQWNQSWAATSRSDDGGAVFLNGRDFLYSLFSFDFKFQYFEYYTMRLCVWDPWPIGPTSQVFGAFKENLLQVARSASLAARDSYTRAYQHLLRRVA